MLICAQAITFKVLALSTDSGFGTHLLNRLDTAWYIYMCPARHCLRFFLEMAKSPVNKNEGKVDNEQKQQISKIT